IPKAQRPRLLTVDDQPDESQRALIRKDKDLGFVIRHRFVPGHRPQYIVAAVDDAVPARAFIAVIEDEGGQYRLRFKADLNSVWFALSSEIQRNCFNGLDAIQIVFTVASDNAAYLIWDGKKFMVIEACKN